MAGNELAFTANTPRRSRKRQLFNHSVKATSTAAMPMASPGAQTLQSLTAPSVVPSRVGPPLGFACRISTFYSAAKSTYSETYEPARPSQFGAIGRIESRLLGGRWRHAAYCVNGRQITHGCGHVLFEDDQLPLLFDPERERQFAQHILTSKDTVVWLGSDVMVHGSKDGQSVGVIRLQAN